MIISQTYATDPRGGVLTWAITSSARLYIKADKRRGRLEGDDGPDARTSRRDAMDACGMAAATCRLMEPVPWWHFDELFAGGALTDYVFDWMHGDHNETRSRRYWSSQMSSARRSRDALEEAINDMRQLPG